MNQATWLTVITSAAIGALTAAVITWLDHWADRRSRRSELAMAKALDIAIVRTDLTLKLAEKNDARAVLFDHVVVAEEYYRWLKHLMEHGRLPGDIAGRLPQAKKRDQARR